MTTSLITGTPPSVHVLAVADLLQGSQGLYTVGVAILVFFALLAGAGRGVAELGRGRVGLGVGLVLAGVFCAVIIGSSYAIYLSAKKTVDQHTGITSGQFG